MKTIVFRADGNSVSGLGHLYRIFALYEMYREHFNCLLLTRSDSSTEIIPDSISYKTIDVSHTDEPGWMASQYEPGRHIIVCDGYQFDSVYQQALKALGFFLVYVDDLVKPVTHADIVINHALSVRASEYSSAGPTQFALGPRFAMLRPLFLEAAAKAPRPRSMDRAFVCFGGADPADLSYKAAMALLGLPGVQEVNVVLGAAYVHKSIMAISDGRLTLYRNIGEKELVEVLDRCGFAVVPSSNILYEVCAVKMPVLSGYYVENQKRIWRGAVEKGLIFDGGDLSGYTADDFREKTVAMLKESDPKYIDRQAALFDGHIRVRFLSLLCDPEYRRATADDLMLVFGWANDELSRKNSYQSGPIDLQTHETWFLNKIKDPNAQLFIAGIAGTPAGLIRYEKKNGHSLVGIMLDGIFRGAGLASRFLKDTAREYFRENSEPVFAYIKKNNIASVRSFEKANYRFMKEEVVHGAESFVYRLDKKDV